MPESVAATSASMPPPLPAAFFASPGTACCSTAPASSSSALCCPSAPSLAVGESSACCCCMLPWGAASSSCGCSSAPPPVPSIVVPLLPALTRDSCWRGGEGLAQAACSGGPAEGGAGEGGRCVHTAASASGMAHAVPRTGRRRAPSGPQINPCAHPCWWSEPGERARRASAPLKGGCLRAQVQHTATGCNCRRLGSGAGRSGCCGPVLCVVLGLCGSRPGSAVGGRLKA